MYLVTNHRITEKWNYNNIRSTSNRYIKESGDMMAILQVMQLQLCYSCRENYCY